MGGGPNGDVTFLFTDVEGSTRLHQRLGSAYPPLQDRQCDLVTAAVEAAGGVRLNTMGDGVFAAFPSADAAVAACVAAQRALMAEPWPPDAVVRVRMGVHTGPAEPDDDGGYTSIAVHQAARICSAAHGGQVLVSAATARAAAGHVADDVSMADLGEFTLRDFDQPVRLFQAAAPGVLAAFPAVRAVPRSAHNVPEVFTSFVGRERELLLLARALATNRQVTLVGPGGIGKTRVAFETTRRFAGDYAGGAWMVLLASADEAGVAEAIATVVGARDAAGLDRIETLVDRLREQRLLLVLDNCEHVVDAVAELVPRLLAACPQLTVFATSREPLRIDGEHVVRLDPLALPGATDPDAIGASEAVRLFVQRAEAADARFTLSPANAVDVAHICRRLDGVPLAIELAAARVGHLPVAEIESLLRDRFTILTTNARGRDARHQTLHNAIAWSHQLLSEAERLLFRRLAVFRAPFTLDAAEQVCADDGVTPSQVFDLVTSLVDKSLVMLADTRTALRYRMLVTIREFAGEQLADAGERDALLTRHSEFVVRRFAALSPVSVDSESSSVFTELDDLETDAMAAWQRLRQSGDAHGAQVLATRLARLHFHRGTHRQGLELVQEAARLPGGEDDLRAWLLYREALFHAVMGDPTAAQAPIDAAVALATGSDDPELPSCVWHVAGDVAFMHDDFGRARECYETARTLSHDAELDALLTIRIAELDADGAASPAVASAYGAAAEHFRSTGDMFNVARCLTGHGAALLRLGDEDAATALAEAVEAATAAAAEAEAALAAVLLATSMVRHGAATEGAEIFAGVDAWERQHGPAVDAMLVAHAEDVRQAVAAARAEVRTDRIPSAQTAAGVADVVRQARLRTALLAPRAAASGPREARRTPAPS